MLGPPRLWDVLTQIWCPVPASVGWLWWRALVRTKDPLALAWKQAFLDFATQDRAVSGDVVTTFLAQIASPRQLIDLVEQLEHEGTLLRRDAHQLQELVLRQTDRTGQWKHQQHRTRKERV